MAEKTAVTPPAARLVDQNRMQIEFTIDDLVKQLITDRLRPITSCNGCNSCSAAAETVNPAAGVRR